MNFIGSRQVSIAESCEHGNELIGSIKNGDIFLQLSGSQLSRKDFSVPRHSNRSFLHIFIHVLYLPPYKTFEESSETAQRISKKFCVGGLHKKLSVLSIQDVFLRSLNLTSSVVP